MSASSDYSVQNGMRFQWSSMTGQLHPERVRHLEGFLCGKKVLDAGCGGGAFVEFLCARGLEVTGLDYHRMFLDVARSRPGATGTYVEGDITALPFPDKSFDCAYCFDVLEHVDDFQALSELIRVSRSRVIIAVPGTDPNYFGGQVTFHHYKDLTHLRTYTQESLAKLFRSFGQHNFEIIPEIPISVHDLAISHILDDPAPTGWRSRLRNLFHRVLRRSLRHARYRSFHSGWAAVLYLEPPFSPVGD